MDKPEDTRTEIELIQEAWAVQDACNLSGVVHSFSRALDRLRKLCAEAPGRGSEWVNTHTVAKLYGSKIVSLAGELPIDLDSMPGFKDACPKPWK